MNISIFKVFTMAVITVLSGSATFGQIPGRSSQTKPPISAISKKAMPDLNGDLAIFPIPTPGTFAPAASGPQTGSMFAVTVKNLSDVDVNTPFTVWLRVWKPTDDKSSESPTSGKTSFLWGGTQSVKQLKAHGQIKMVFTVNMVPPGGWQIDCGNSGGLLGGCFQSAKAHDDPLHWRVFFVIDPENSVKESNEVNNHN